MARNNFDKFINKGATGSKKKEQIRQEKKQAREEKNAYFEQLKKERKTEREGQHPVPPKANQARDPNEPRFRRQAGPSRPHKPTGSTYKKTRSSSAPADRQERKGGYAGKPKFAKTSTSPEAKTVAVEKPAFKKTGNTAPKPPVKSVTGTAKESTESAYKDGMMPLNKFVAHAGVCSRRDAADLVKSGKVHVNGKPVTEPGFKVTVKDEVKVHGKQVVAKRNFVYILLNKPKDFLTTTDDPEGRKTVMDIIKSATDERVYPIGRLDRNTTGVLLLTNDGELAQKLSHPSYMVKKIYEVRLDKPLQKKDFEKIAEGIQLEDGFVAPDVLAYADAKDKSIIGIEIHSGRNRIVRRIFESVGYDVRNLDRVMYANLTKKNVERGKWRFLSEKEVRLLKFLNASYTKKPDLKPAR
jgi:23S rRNA pseudouridine2605 synthase